MTHLITNTLLLILLILISSSTPTTSIAVIPSTPPHLIRAVSQPVFTSSPSIVSSLTRGALFRILADLSGGTCFENIKSYMTLHSTSDKSITFKEAVTGICYAGDNNTNDLTSPKIRINLILSRGKQTQSSTTRPKFKPLNLYRGTSTRLLEASLIGFLFHYSFSHTNNYLSTHPTFRGLRAPVRKGISGIVGGVAQSVVMTCTSTVQTLSLKHNLSVKNTIRNVHRQNGGGLKGVKGFYNGFQGVCVRQGSNWMSRQMFTEAFRPFVPSGIKGEVLAGVGGGILALWNTPLEVVRVRVQSFEDDYRRNNSIKNIADGGIVKRKVSYSKAFRDIYNEQGIRGLFRGVEARGLQSVWQTAWMVVLPNIMGG